MTPKTVVAYSYPLRRQGMTWGVLLRASPPSDSLALPRERGSVRLRGDSPLFHPGEKEAETDRDYRGRRLAQQEKTHLNPVPRQRPRRPELESVLPPEKLSCQGPRETQESE